VDFKFFHCQDIRKDERRRCSVSSHIDGSKHLFTPERAIDIQRSIGGDIIMAFDECTPYPCEYSEAKKSMELTHRWLKRCCDHFDATPPLYGYEQNVIPDCTRKYL
jgi:queuine tRNA-ribosyltransferase